MRHTCMAIAAFLAVGRAGRIDNHLRKKGLNGPVVAQPVHEISFHNAPSATGDYLNKQIEDKLPEQGYTSDHSRADNPPVHHTNWDTATADWGSEYGPEHLRWSPWDKRETFGPDYPTSPGGGGGGSVAAPSSPSAPAEGPSKPKPPPWVKSSAASQVLGGFA